MGKAIQIKSKNKWATSDIILPIIVLLAASTQVYTALTSSTISTQICSGVAAIFEVGVVIFLVYKSTHPTTKQ